MKKWTKQEFIDAVEPCGYKFRIWWWFLWHRHVTLLNLVTTYMASNIDRLWAIKCLDKSTYLAHLDGDFILSFDSPSKNDGVVAANAIRSIREELLRNKEQL